MMTKLAVGQNRRGKLCFLSVPLCALAGIAKFGDLYKTLGLCLLVTVVCMIYKLLSSSRIIAKYDTDTSSCNPFVRDMGFVLTALCAVFADISSIKWFFLFGVIMSAVFAGILEAFISSFAFALIITLFSNITPEFVANSFLAAIVATVLVGYYSDFSSLIHCVIIMLSFEISFFVIFYGINPEKLMSAEHLLDMATIICSIAFGWMIHKKTAKPEQPENTCETSYSAEDEAESGNMVSAVIEDRIEDVTRDYSKFLDENYPLYLKVKSEPELFHSSETNAGLAKKISEIIGANSVLSEAGTFYAECGRLISSNYIKEGLILAKQSELPEEVVAFIKEHNFKLGNPKSRETGIAMVVCKLSSTVKYLKSKKLKYSVGHVVNEVTDSCLMSGKLIDAGLSLGEYRIIKNYLFEEAKSVYDYFD